MKTYIFTFTIGEYKHKYEVKCNNLVQAAFYFEKIFPFQSYSYPQIKE